jgi:hypothetical protein
MTTDRTPTQLTEPELEVALRALGQGLAWPAPPANAANDSAARARRRIEAGGVRPGRWSWRPGPARRPLGSSLGLAAAAVLVIAAIAAAIGLGLPGIRIVPTSSPIATAPSVAPSTSPVSAGAPSATLGPSPTVGPLGWTLGLGEPVAVDTATTVVGIPVRLPPASDGPPAAAWLIDGRLSLVWPAGRRFPTLREPGIGLILSEFRGSLDAGYFQKITGPQTTIETVRVGGSTGYWISGTPHEIVFVNANGDPVFDSRRIVGDTLMWTDGEVTLRLESSLDRDAAITLAESLR